MEERHVQKRTAGIERVSTAFRGVGLFLTFSLSVKVLELIELTTFVHRECETFQTVVASSIKPVLPFAIARAQKTILATFWNDRKTH